MPEDKKVNVNKVAKAALSIGQFALFQSPGLNLIVTHWFILSINEEQFWKIRCKLEAELINTWLFKGKEGLKECEGASLEKILELYSDLVFQDKAEQLTDTELTYRDIKLFTDGTYYYGLRAQHLDMIGYPPVINHKTERQSVIVDDCHVFTIVDQDNIKCEYLRDLIYGGIVQ